MIMSIPIARATTKAKTCTPIPDPEEEFTSEESVLPNIDLLSLCTQAEQHHRYERRNTNEKSTRIHNTNHMFRPSNYGIDGSFPPRVSSWSHRTRHSRGVQGRPRDSRCRSEMSFAHDEAARYQSPKSGFSSPCFQGSSPPIRCRLQSYHPTVRSMSSCGGAGAQDFIVSRVNLSKRPKKRHLSFKTDVQGNIRNVAESNSRTACAFRQSFDSQLSSFPRESTGFCDDSNTSQSKVPYFGRDVWLPDAEYDVSDVIIIPGVDYQASNLSNNDQTPNDILVDVTVPSNTAVKKIDIKLPCLEN